MATRIAHSERRGPAVRTAAALVMLTLMGCTTTPSPAPSRASTPSVAPNATSTAGPIGSRAPIATVAPTVPPAPPSQGPSLPEATNAALKDVYAALRPANLRAPGGPRVFTRGSVVNLSYEIVNTSSASIAVPLTVAGDQPASWYGRIQSWIEPLDAGARVAGCLADAARKGAWYAVGGHLAAVFARESIPPGAGLTQGVALPAATSACLPVGRYRYHLEYLPVAPSGTDDVIAALTTDVELRDPAAWATDLGRVGPPGRASFVPPTATKAGSSRVSLNGLPPGEKASFEIWLGCDRKGSPLVPATQVTASPEGTFSQSRSISPSSAVRRTLAAGSRPAIWYFSHGRGICVEYLGLPFVVPEGRGPTTWGGALLREDLGGGFSVAAASETALGRPSQAFDGNVNLTWNSGGNAPAWIELDLGRDREIAGIRLLPAQLPAEARTTHRIWGRPSGNLKEVLLATAEGVTRDNAWFEVTFSKPAGVRYVRIETVASPSWVAWREIEIPGVVLPKPSAMPVGYHDGPVTRTAWGTDCSTYGWTSDPDAPTNVVVRILVDGREVWSGPAGDTRSDVSAAGAGDVTSGFALDLRPYVRRDTAHQIRVQAKDIETGVWVDLGSTPHTLTCR